MGNDLALAPSGVLIWVLITALTSAELQPRNAIDAEPKQTCLSKSFPIEWLATLRVGPVRFEYKALRYDDSQIEQRPEAKHDDCRERGSIREESVIPPLRRFRIPLALATVAGVGLGSFCLVRVTTLSNASPRRFALEIICCLTGLVASAALYYADSFVTRSDPRCSLPASTMNHSARMNGEGLRIASRT